MLISSADILQIADVVHQVEDELLDKTHFRNKIFSSPPVWYRVLTPFLHPSASKFKIW